jgi:glucuronate isomerase
MRRQFLHDNRLFPADSATRAIAQRLFKEVRDLPIVSPHGHTQAEWFATNAAFPDPARLFIVPDHYIFRMLYSQGVAMEDLGVGAYGALSEQREEFDARRVWRIFADHYYLFRGTPTRLWLDYIFQNLFDLNERLTPKNADAYFDAIDAALKTPEFLPRALYEEFRIEVLASTDSPLDSLEHHIALAKTDWRGRVIPTFRPDAVVDPDFADFATNVVRLGEMTREDTSTWHGYLAALRSSRARFKAAGATATDHGHPTAATADLDATEATKLFDRILAGAQPGTLAESPADHAVRHPADKELFRAQILTEMARMSIDDGLVMQLHPGAYRNHNAPVHTRFGRDVGSDIPAATDYVHALAPLLNRFGNDARLTLIVFTLDESAYSRELAPLAGHYPALRLGPAWWFHDSPEGMMRFRELTTESAGFYNTVGFNDDTRAFLSIPTRHDVARRIDCSFLARLVAEHRLEEDEAREVAIDLSGNLALKAYKLDTKTR